jgi:hypothetical protein
MDYQMFSHNDLITRYKDTCQLQYEICKINALYCQELSKIMKNM